MTNGVPFRRLRRSPPSWDEFKARVRRADRDSLIRQAAAASATIARGEAPDDWARRGLTPWNIADVARTSLAWGAFARPLASAKTLVELCNVDANIADEGESPDVGPSTRAARALTRIIFEQIPGQRSVLAEVSRTVLLFGSAAEYPDGFEPEAMGPGWFEDAMGGLSLDEYVESIVLISVVAQQHEGGFSPDWLERPEWDEFDGLFAPAAVRQTFQNHLLTNVDDFRRANRTFQEPLSAVQKKYAFNPLAGKPFIGGLTSVPIAPWVQAIVAKALPPAIYHAVLPILGEGFTHDLGAVFQHYVGRQLALVGGSQKVHREVAYGPRRNRVDSCDWFLELPDIVVLVECKARQPIESLRVVGDDWLVSVEGSISKGIRQLNRSDRDIADIAAEEPKIDTTKPRVGLVVTLEPFFLNQNWFVRELLEDASFPVGVVSAGELEAMVLLSPDELQAELLLAKGIARDNEMILNQAIQSGSERENPILVAAWESIGIFERAAMADRAGDEAHDAEA